MPREKTENMKWPIEGLDFGVRRHRWKIAVINKFKKLHDMMENFSRGPEDYILKNQKETVKLKILKHN